MRGLPSIGRRERKRTRRWDVVILGGALPGLVAAVVLGMRGLRVLVLEEAAAARRHPALREPFFMTGAGRDSLLGACLRALGVPLIDQRRIETEPVALQLACGARRPDLGEVSITAREWAAWGLAKPDDAIELAHALRAAAEAECEAMLAAPLFHVPFRSTWRRRRRRPALTLQPAPREARPTGPRGLPAQLASAPAPLAALLDAQVRALSNLGASPPGPEARAWLLGAPLAGGGHIVGRSPWLGEMFRRRIRALHGEFRLLEGSFRLVSSARHPGVAQELSEEICVGRAFVLNAARSAVAAVVDQSPLPAVLRGPPPARQRVALRLRVEKRVFPEGMARRAVWLGDPGGGSADSTVVTLRSFARAGDPEQLDVVGAAVAPADEAGAALAEASIRAAIAALMPFAESGVARESDAAPRWDHDGWLLDPTPETAWPAEPGLRLALRQHVYQLDRAAVAGLGLEGDLLLGWRAGEAIARDLA